MSAIVWVIGFGATHAVLLGDALEYRNHFEGSRGIQPGSGLVQEKQARPCDQLRRDTYAPLLAARNALIHGSPDEVVSHTGQAEIGKEPVDTRETLCFAHRWCGEPGGEVERFADGQGTNQRVFLLYVCGQATKVARINWHAVEVEQTLGGCCWKATTLRERM